MPDEEYTVNLPYGLTFKDLVGVGITGTVLRLDAVIKCVAPHRQSSLSRELRVYQRLQEQCYDHPRFLRFYGAIENGLVLGYAANGSLRDYIQSYEQTRSPLLSLRLQWIEQILDSVATLHSSSILHGDLSCNNFLLDEDLNIKGGDFAGSSIDGEAALTFYETRSAHPHLKDVTCESEVFALGSCLYEVITGRKPYSELSDMEIEAAYSKEQYPDVTGLEACGEVIKKCWARKYDNVADILQEIRAESEGIALSLSSPTIRKNVPDRTAPITQTIGWLASHWQRFLPVTLLLPVLVWRFRR